MIMTTIRLVFALMISTPATAQEIRRLAFENIEAPISAAVSVPRDARTLYVSGTLPDMADATAQRGTAAAYGLTETQTLSVLAKIKEVLGREGMGMGDVVSMRVFLVGDARLGGRMDFAGMMRAYRSIYGSDQKPKVPARTAVQVVGLPIPGALVEIEVVAAKMK